MCMSRSLRDLRVRAASAVLSACVIAVVVMQATTALAQSTIPAHLTKLRPIKCMAYDPRPSDWPVGTDDAPSQYFDSDFFNGDYTGIWGDDGQPGTRRDLETFQDAGLNLLHLYNWNAQRTNHKTFLDAAEARGIKVMVPISNFTAKTIMGTCGDNCTKYGLRGYKVAFDQIESIFKQVYFGTAPHPAAAMWGIYNEYDLNQYNPYIVAFAAQAILTLEKKYNIPEDSRLPIAVPISDAVWDAAARARLPKELRAALELANQQWDTLKPGKPLPGAVLATMALSNAYANAPTTYQSLWDSMQVDAIPKTFWKNRVIAVSNPFRNGASLLNFLTDPDQFQGAWPGTTDFNSLPTLFFGEMGWSQKNSGGSLEQQASVVLDQIKVTNPLATNASTPQGYFLGSCFFQHTIVDPSQFQAFNVDPNQFATRPLPQGTPCPACGKTYRIDVLTPLPVWNSVRKGFASAAEDLESLSVADETALESP